MSRIGLIEEFRRTQRDAGEAQGSRWRAVLTRSSKPKEQAHEKGEILPSIHPYLKQSLIRAQYEGFVNDKVHIATQSDFREEVFEIMEYGCIGYMLMTVDIGHRHPGRRERRRRAHDQEVQQGQQGQQTRLFPPDLDIRPSHIFTKVCYCCYPITQSNTPKSQFSN